MMNKLSDLQIEELLKIEVLRILLKHPYQRQPSFAKQKVLTQASNVTINDSYMIKDFVKIFIKGLDYKLPSNLCFEEYYALIYEILSHANPNSFCGTSIVPTDKPAISDDDDDGVSNNDNLVEQNGFSPEEQTSELWEEDEEICYRINDIIETAQITDTWGTVAGKLKDITTASRKVELDYRGMLSHFRTSILSSKRILTRMRPSRRFGFTNMGSRYQLATNLLIAVDVSESVTDKSLSFFFSVINRFFKYGIEKLDVIQFDRELKSEKPIPMKRAKNEIKINGRGGTNFQPASDFYCTHPEYDGLIYFTDGDARIPIFNTKRPIEVLWVLTGRNEFERHIKWINTIKGNRATYIPKPE